jgi:hypothetical protein
MPKPFYGEVPATLGQGEHLAVIKEMIDTGHQWTKDGTKAYRKFFIVLAFPDLGIEKWALSNFGINSWLSKSQPPFVGFYELVTAVEGRELDAEELKTYDLWTLVGKTVVAVVEPNEKGYQNIVVVKNSIVELPTDGMELVAYDYEEASLPHILIGLPKRANEMIKASKEWQDANTEIPEAGETPAEAADGKDEIKVSDIAF